MAGEAPKRDIELVLVTGAGASRSFGVNQTKLPLMPDWSEYLVQKLAGNMPGYAELVGLEPGLDGEEFESRMGRFLRLVEGFKEIAPILPIIPSLTADQPPAANPQQWQAWHLHIVGQLEQVTSVIHESPYEKFGAPSLDPVLPAQAYGALLNEFHINRETPWVYATTNYESIGEDALSSLGLIPELGEVASWEVERDLQVDPSLLGSMPRNVPVLHLHGKVGWFKRDGRPRSTVPNERFEPRAGPPIVMLPDLEKDYAADPIIEALWRQCEEALRRARRVFILGHSLHDKALIEALTQNIDRLDRVAATFLDDEATREGAEAEVNEKLPGASAIPIVFEAGADFGKRDLRNWFTETEAMG